MLRLKSKRTEESLGDIYERHGISYCGQKRQWKMRLSMKTFKSGFFLYIGYIGIFGLGNFFMGYGIGGIEQGMKYTAYFLSISAVLLFFFIPITGVVMAITFDQITTHLMSLLGMSHNFWIDAMVNSLTLVAGIFFQTVVMTYLVYTAVTRVKKQMEPRCILEQ